MPPKAILDTMDSSGDEALPPSSGGRVVVSTDDSTPKASAADVAKAVALRTSARQKKSQANDAGSSTVKEAPKKASQRKKGDNKDKDNFLIKDVMSYFPQFMKDAMIKSRSSEEWNGKMRYLMAAFFVRFHHCHDKNLRDMVFMVKPQGGGNTSTADLITVRTFMREL